MTYFLIRLTKVVLFILVLNIKFAPDIQGQSTNHIKPNIWENLQYDLNQMTGGIIHSYARPLHWEKENWKTFFEIVILSTTFYAFDDQISEWFQNQEGNIPKYLKDYGWYYGNPQNNYAITGAVYLTGLLLNDEKIRRLGVLMLSSASSAGLLQQLMKSAVGRARPRTNLESNHFRPFSKNSNFHSFPSGHTILAFTNAHAVAKEFENIWIKGGIYSIGVLPALSRLWNRSHWFSDVVVGLVLSIATVDSIDKFLKGKYQKDNHYKRKRSRNKLTFNLNVTPNQIQLTAIF